MTRHLIHKTIYLLFMLVFLSMCTGCDANTVPMIINEVPTTMMLSDRTEEYKIVFQLSSMTTEEKVAQVFFISPDALAGSYHVTSLDDSFKAAYQKYPVGGLVYFADNLDNCVQIQTMCKDSQNISKDIIGLPIFIGIDEEGGVVDRLHAAGIAGCNALPDMSTIGATGNTKKAAAIGDKLGQRLYDLGFNLDFAPVADVYSNPENKIVKTRSFGSDPSLVTKMVYAELDALQSHNIYGCLKHFPGHGSTEGDTHKGYAYTSASKEELLACDLIPFAAAADNDVTFIMVSHIAAPNVTKDDTPASMSSIMLQDILQDELSYDGIIITDSLMMGAITDHYSSKEAAITAFKAGNDMLLMPEDFESAYTGLLSAVKKGDISEERLNQSVYKIIKAKQQLPEQ